MTWSQEDMVRRAAAELSDGQTVNLGIGMPTEVSNHIAPDIRVVLHSENGLLVMGPFPYEDEVEPQIINAGKQTVTVLPGGSAFDSALSFAMIRSGRIDVAILGGLEVACNGDLANWTVPGKMTTGMGGAMDLAAGARRVVVLQWHAARDGSPKLVSRLGLPPTALGCVRRVITDLGVFDPAGDHFLCVEQAPGVDEATVRARTGAPVRF
jgi:3-oxoacid CoA-transferase subunit B